MTDFTLGPWKPVSSGVWVAVAEPAAVNLVLVAGDKSALLVDTGSSPAQGADVRASAESLLEVPLSTVVVTHAHYDHAFGLAAFTDLRTVGHESLADWLTSDAAASDAAQVGVDPGSLAPPARGLALAMSVDLGGRRVEIAHLGRGHTGSDLVVVVPDADLVVVGDLVESAGPPGIGPDSWVHEWASTLDGVIGLMTDDTRAVPGHGEPVDRAFVYETRGRVASVSGEVRRLAVAGVSAAGAATRGDWAYPADAVAPGLEAAYVQLGPVTVKRTLPLA